MQAGYNHGEDVVVAVSLAKVSVTSSVSRAVIMSHPLKRISYATCDPASCLFSFMSRQPSSQYNIQQCHTFRWPVAFISLSSVTALYPIWSALGDCVQQKSFDAGYIALLLNHWLFHQIRLCIACLGLFFAFLWKLPISKAKCRKGLDAEAPIDESTSELSHQIRDTKILWPSQNMNDITLTFRASTPFSCELLQLKLCSLIFWGFT